jgi:hypothetical protein
LPIWSILPIYVLTLGELKRIKSFSLQFHSWTNLP